MPDLVFKLTEAERERVRAWMASHDCRAVPDSFGGLLTYQFTPCGIGYSVKVLCPCGATLDLTDVESW